jgi:glycosyltransferase involved in cell wall biosynthesis
VSVPRVSVIMPVFNAVETVAASIRGILNQTLGDFELLIIDDGSTDGSSEVISGFDDRRIRGFRNDGNLRLARTLNRGLDEARAPLIARIDADDIAYPHRLETQANYLDSHPEMALAGTAMRKFAGRKKLGISRPATDPDLLRWRQHFSNQLQHPTVMFRASALRDLQLKYGVVPEWARQAGCLESIDHLSEDYLLFGLLALRAGVVNMPDVLVDYRVHDGSVSNSQTGAQYDVARAVSRLLFSNVLGRPVAREPVDLLYFTRAQSAPESAVEAACSLIDETLIAHGRRFSLSSKQMHALDRDARLRKRVLRAEKRGMVNGVLEFLKAPIWPHDMEEFRLLVRTIFSERAIERLRRISMAPLSAVSAIRRAGAEHS